MTRALAELEVAAKSLPNNASVFELKGYIQRRQGKQEEAIRSFERASDLDPRNSYMLQQIALSYRHLHRFAEEKSVLDRALAIDPNNVDNRLERAAVDFYWKADPASVASNGRFNSSCKCRHHSRRGRLLAFLRPGRTRCRCRKKCRDRSW